MRRRIAKTEPCVGRELLPASFAIEQLIADRARGRDPALDGPPPLLASRIPVSDLVPPGPPATDVALHADAACISLVGHEQHLRGDVDAGPQVPRSSARMPPRVQIAATEVELAARSVLLGRDRALGGELAKCVAMNPDILRSVAGVEPLIGSRLGGEHPRRDHCRDSLREAINELLDDRQLGEPHVTGRRLGSQTNSPVSWRNRCEAERAS